MRTLFLFLFATSVALGADWSLPAANRGVWYNNRAGVGIPGGAEQYTAGEANDRAVTGTVINMVTDYGADPTGATNTASALQSAISAVSGTTVIYFPAGTYLFSSGGIWNGQAPKTNFTIRGAGPSLTTFHIQLASDGKLIEWQEPGSPNYAAQAVTNADKTKGVSALSVSSSADYAENHFVKVTYQNETDSTRIQAGAPPVLSAKGYPGMLAMFARVTSVSSGVVNIDPPLPVDATNLDVTITKYELGTWRNEGIGIEDLRVTFDSSSHAQWAFITKAAAYNWFYNVHFDGWSRPAPAANGSPIRLVGAYRCEIRKCRFDAEESVGADGAIEMVDATSCVIEDNIFTGGWGQAVYTSERVYNNVITCNYLADGAQTLFHNAHPALNVIEGNYAYNHQSDGYHGSSSHNTIYRNVYTGGGGWYSLRLNRFKRQYVVAGNAFGDATNIARISWGDPNFNENSSGTASPTTGDFWDDWNVTGTLNVGGRLSDTQGVFTVSGGNWFTGDSPSGAASLQVILKLSADGFPAMENGTVTNVSGDQVTISWGSGSLPDEGDTVYFYPGVAGFQERDRDVQASTTLVKNYWNDGSGSGAIQDDTSDTLPTSLVYTEKPAFFGTLDWPPFDPSNTSTHTATQIPAGYRYINGNEDYLTGGGSSGGGTATIQTLNVGTLVLP